MSDTSGDTLSDLSDPRSGTLSAITFAARLSAVATAVALPNDACASVPNSNLSGNAGTSMPDATAPLPSDACASVSTAISVAAPLPAVTAGALPGNTVGDLSHAVARVPDSANHMSASDACGDMPYTAAWVSNS